MQFETYLRGIGIETQTYLARLTSVFNIVSGFCPEDIRSIFVSEYRNAENTMVIDSLYLFSDNLIMEIKQPFAIEFNWDIMPMKNQYDWIEVRSTSFDYEFADDSSRLLVTGHLHGNKHTAFKSSSRNCNHLWAILNEHLKPNLKHE